MTIVNRRNAVIGWAALKLGKRAAQEKAAKQKKRRIALVGMAAGAAGALAFWRIRRGGEEPPPI